MRVRILLANIVIVVLFILCACTENRQKPDVIDLAVLCQNKPAPSAALVRPPGIKSGLESAVSVYVIRQESSFFGELGETWGSGAIIDSERGFILTAAHVIRGAASVKVTTRIVDPEGKIVDGESMYAVVLSVDWAGDTAVLMVRDKVPLPPAFPIACAWTPFPGNPVMQFGCRTEMTFGNVDGYTVIPTGGPESNYLISATAVVNYGDSGGAVIDSETGGLVGIVSSKSAVDNSVRFVYIGDLLSFHHGRKPE